MKAATRDVIIKFTDQFEDTNTDEQLWNDDPQFAIEELLNSGGLTKFSVVINNVQRDVESTDGDADVIALIQGEIDKVIVKAFSAVLGNDLGSIASPSHQHDSQGNCLNDDGSLMFPEDNK